MQVLWFIPTHGDGRYLGTAIAHIPHPQLSQGKKAIKVVHNN
jgi:hypothetical protein